MSYFRKHEISVEITEKQMLMWAHVSVWLTIVYVRAVD